MYFPIGECVRSRRSDVSYPFYMYFQTVAQKQREDGIVFVSMSEAGADGRRALVFQLPLIPALYKARTWLTPFFSRGLFAVSLLFASAVE